MRPIVRGNSIIVYYKIIVQNMLFQCCEIAKNYFYLLLPFCDLFLSIKIIPTFCKYCSLFQICMYTFHSKLSSTCQYRYVRCEL
jgi:hypothetical protein